MHKLIAAALIFVTPSSSFADWPAFLGGQNRDSVAYSLPEAWSPDAGITWQTALPGHGQSSPIVVGSRIYLTAVDGPMKERNIVAAYDLASGKQLWQHNSPSDIQVKNDVYTSRAAPTSVGDAEGVYAFFESGNLIALSNDGAVRWERSLVTDYGKYVGRFGLGGSLAQLKDQIFVLADNDGPSYLLAIDKSTGKTIWKTDRSSRIAWSSPMIIPVDGDPQIVVSSSGSVDGYDPTTGKRLWTFEDVGGNTVSSPTFVQDGQFLVGASPGRNGENAAGAKQSNLLMKVVRDGDQFKPQVVWRNAQATSSFGSPIAYKGHAYYTNRAGVLYCIDLENGKTAYTARIAESNWATPIGIKDRVYFFGKSGKTTVVAAGPEEKVLAENVLYKSKGGGGPGGFGGEIQYGVALSDQGAVVRTGSNLYLIGSD